VKIRISESAFDDLEKITEYYEEQGVPHIGANFVTQIIEHIETLGDNPKIGRVVPEFNSEEIRELIHVPFRIVYTIDLKMINVVRVWRSERLLKLVDSSNDDEI